MSCSRKMPTKCPICGGTLLNKYVPIVLKSRSLGITKGQKDKEYLVMSCEKTLTHKIKFDSLTDKHDSLYNIELFIAPSSLADWVPHRNLLYITSYTNPSMEEIKSEIQIPYFEPDFSNYKKLVRKIKTYILFS